MQESRSNAPPISTELPLLKDKFGLQSSTLRAFKREICCNDTFNLLLKTIFKELFTNKGEILSCKSIRPRKNRKNSQAHYVRTRDKSGSNSPPFQRNVQIPSSPGMMHSQMPGVCPGGGGMLKFRIDRRIMKLNLRLVSNLHHLSSRKAGMVRGDAISIFVLTQVSKSQNVQGLFQGTKITHFLQRG